MSNHDMVIDIKKAPIELDIATDSGNTTFNTKIRVKYL